VAPRSLRVGRDLTAEERRTAVLRAAVECVAVTGYDNLRLRDVARAAGVSTGLLQHYFETRDELVAEAFRQASEDLLQEWGVLLASDPPPWERLDALVSQLALRDGLRTHCMVWVEFATASARIPAMREGFRAIYDKWYALVRETVEDGTNAGIFTPVASVPDVVELLLSHIDGCELNIASDPDGMTGPRMRELTLRLAATLLQYDGYDGADASTGSGAREVARSAP
jgi:AcrR family transcriptional regulator